MHINQIVAMVLVVVVILLLVNGWPQITPTVASLSQMGPGHSIDDKTTGLFTLGIIGVVLVAIVKILTNRGSK